MRPLTEEEIRVGKKGVGGVDDGHEKLHDDSKIVTVVPSAKEDYRGWFGDLERAMTAYKDMTNHAHNDPEDALPLFRLMTWLDPQFVRGWTTGGIIKARDRSSKGTAEALAFLNEGLQANAESVDLMTTIAFLKITRNHDLKGAIPLLEQGRLSALKRLKTLPEDEMDALNQCYRWLGLAYRDQGEGHKARTIAIEGLQLFPDDGLLVRLLNPPKSLQSESARREWLKKLLAEEKSAGEHDDHH
jgi:tetratricopeptide (TPR) repeat protein